MHSETYQENTWHVGHTISSTFIMMILLVGVISIILCRHALGLCARIFPFAINTNPHVHLLNNPHVTLPNLAAQWTQHHRAEIEPSERGPTSLGSPAPPAASRPIDLPQRAFQSP